MDVPLAYRDRWAIPRPSIARTQHPVQWRADLGANWSSCGESGAGGAEPAPSGDGWIWDVTTLEGQRTAAGAWTPTLKLATSVASGITVSIYIRAYKRSAAGIYTLIAEASKTGWALTSTPSAQTFNAATGIETDFGPGDKLYIDIACNVTANTANSDAATINVYENGGADEACVSPGYDAIPGTDGSGSSAVIPASSGQGVAVVEQFVRGAFGEEAFGETEFGVHEDAAPPITNITGSGASAALPASVGSAEQIISGTGASPVWPASSGTGQTAFFGSGATSVLPMSSGSGTVLIAGAGASKALPASSGAGLVPIVGSGSSQVLPASSGTATQLITGTGASKALPAQSGTAILLITGSGSSKALASSRGLVLPPIHLWPRVRRTTGVQ